jgi:hypothetical protein
MKATTFLNVTITIKGEPNEAYDKLCTLLDPTKDGSPVTEYDTEVYTDADDKDQQERSTRELWPDNRENVDPDMEAYNREKSDRRRGMIQ